MKTWRVIRKEVRRVDADGCYLVLHVELEGRQREATVSGWTFDRAEVGDLIGLVLE